MWRNPNTGDEQRIYDELYTTDAWNEAQDEILKQQRSDGCKLERVIAGLMLWSDSTHLAQFGHATAWPIYMFFGNLSKYARQTPDSGICHPIAFIPAVSIHKYPHRILLYAQVHKQLPQSIRTLISTLTSRKDNSELLTHCKRELIHAVWRILLDDDFVEAYKNGIVIKCFDGILRRIFLRIFTYSGDYPEK